MDLIAHGLWAWAGGELLRRRGALTRRTQSAAVALSIAPDLLHVVPVLVGTILGQVSVAELIAYLVATPTTEPELPAWVSMSAHHAHCILHSAVVAGLVTFVAWLLRRSLVLPLAGWWLHILLDVPTHAQDFYPVPVLYPFTYAGFDGIAWSAPWFLAVNYGALAIVFGILYRTRTPTR